MPRNILFICTQNRLRSPTAEQVFADWPAVETASAGLGNDAEVPVSPELLAWADLIFVMEPAHRSRLSAKFKRHLNGKRVICLDIPDDYAYMDPVLIRLLKQKVVRFLPAGAGLA
ncbi:low molecular weight protein tyrosine phosphatase family protein [uncultured Pseudoxanthomonas sp.]|uniref:low molecular weight protein tyrosine phosphatase family protein n=1 Tax=uncultured Pseudoxanthomonas sp. TaxID=281701 RepID=UPI002613515E|nr:low molecular weight protein tyrosine phosphatase family protein [uncultured Pseudoxanthomonas sp.]